MVRFAFVLPLLLSSVAAIASAPAMPRPIIDEVAQQGRGRILARVVWLAPARQRPATFSATLRIGGRTLPVRLTLVSATDRDAAGTPAWSSAAYTADVPEEVAGDAVLSREGETGGYAFRLAAAGDAGAGGQAASPPVRSATAGDAYAVAPAGRNPIAPAPLPAATVSRDNPLLANLAAYRPIYGAFGASQTTAGRIQISFQYQLFGDARAPTADWKDGIRFGYTQRMLWDVGRYSSPFHGVSYMPELFYAVRGATAGGVRFFGQAGIQHESNGKGGDDSRGYQTVYVEPTIAVPLGGYTLEASPRFYQYVFGRDRNADIPRYRGHQSLDLAIGTPDGLKLDTVTRINFGTGHGAAEAELTYPLARLLGVPVYAMLEGFTGYGEDLLDYDRKQSRLRLGLGLVR